jgi:hypothetical protein
LTVRAGPKVEVVKFDDLDQALRTLEARARELADNAPRRALDIKVQRFEPAQQVTARVEIAGPQRLLPSVRGGVDVRGDGSTEPYLGGVRREGLEQRHGETAFRALGRALRDDRG